MGASQGWQLLLSTGCKNADIFLPNDPSAWSNVPSDRDGTKRCEGEYLEELKKRIAKLAPGIYVLCTEGEDTEIDRLGNGDFEDAYELFEKEDFIKLTENSVIQNGENSEAVIDFGKRGLITIKDRTNYAVGRFIVADEGITANTSLKVGEVDVKVDRRYKVIDFSVSTPTCVSGVRGTHFTVKHEESPIKSTVTVYSGEVEVKPTICSAPAKMVSAGQQITVDKNCFGRLEINDTDFSDALGKPCGSDKEFVRSLYQSVLERDLEVSFASGYGGAHMRDLQSGESRSATILAFFNSPEYLDKQKGGQEFIRDAYQAVLGREPRTNESNQWPRIDRNKIIEQLYNSTEYRNLMADCSEIGHQTEGSFSISGQWILNQHNGFIGTLNLQQLQSSLFSGTVTWNRHESGTINGKITGNSIEFTISYPSGIRGMYKGTLDQNGTKMINGTVQGSNGSSASWDASR